MLIAVVVVAVIAAVAVVFVWWASGSSVRRLLKERVVVTLKSGEGFDGVLYRADRRSWELVQATALGVGERGGNAPVNGLLVLPTENVAYCQRP